MKVIALIVVSLLTGFVAGWVVHSGTGEIAEPSAAWPMQPTDTQATDAFRRSQRFLGPSNATLAISACVAASGPGVQCTTSLRPSPDTTPIARSFGFARIDGRWEIAN